MNVFVKGIAPFLLALGIMLGGSQEGAAGHERGGTYPIVQFCLTMDDIDRIHEEAFIVPGAAGAKRYAEIVRDPSMKKEVKCFDMRYYRGGKPTMALLKELVDVRTWTTGSGFVEIWRAIIPWDQTKTAEVYTWSNKHNFGKENTS